MALVLLGHKMTDNFIGISTVPKYAHTLTKSNWYSSKCNNFIRLATSYTNFFFLAFNEPVTYFMNISNSNDTEIRL